MYFIITASTLAKALHIYDRLRLSKPICEKIQHETVCNGKLGVIIIFCKKLERIKMNSTIDSLLVYIMYCIYLLII